MMNLYKKDFPILNQTVHDKTLVYLDSSASNQKPEVVIQTVSQYERMHHANVHRGVYELSRRATGAFEETREAVKQFIHANSLQEIIFTSGTTAAINLVAQSYGRTHFKAGDEIIVSMMEHHSNIVPWQMIAEATGAILKVIPINLAGELDLDAYRLLLSPRTKLVAVAHVSNVLGTINPIQEITRLAHAHQAVVLVDGAQAVAHIPVDVQALDCDFYAFSSHKAYGPTGVGILYGKRALLENMPPYQGGGEMVEQVTFAKTTYNTLPYKFEAGTPNIANVIGFKAAIDYVKHIGFTRVVEHDQALLAYATEQLTTLPGIKLIGTARQKIGIISFVIENVHAHDIGTILDHEGIAVRVGNHCAMPLMQFYQEAACVRASFAIYNSIADIDALMMGLKTVQRYFN